jgi:sugar/nucleoside kinase (ribokinase family)
MNWRSKNTPPDYLIIGHLTKDLVGSGYRLGGTALYSSVMARNMGAQVALFTSGAADLPLDTLDGIRVYNQPGAGTTTFSNQYTSSGRVQILSERAANLDLEQIPESWRKARIVHLAPVAGEVPFSAGEGFPDSALAYSLQGWMRKWDHEGKVFPAPLPSTSLPKRKRLAAFMSLEDLGYNRDRLIDIQNRFPLLLFTLGPEGADLIQGDSAQRLDGIPNQEVDPTGAGDIFAGAFMVSWILREKSKSESAGLANTLASLSINHSGAESVPTKQEISKLEKVQG